MKNTHRTGLILAVMATLILTAGCGSKKQTFEMPKPVTPSQTTKVTTTAVTTESTTTPTEKYQIHFKNGVWQGRDGYFLFSGETSGRTMSYESKDGIAFEYEAFSDGSAVFHMGSAEDNTNVTIETQGEYEAYIKWSDDNIETLLYVDDYDLEHFDFTSTNDVKEAALKYFDRQNEHRPTDADITSCGHKVALELYDMNEDEKTVVARYTINRVTMQGVDSGFDNIDFNEPKEEKKD